MYLYVLQPLSLLNWARYARKQYDLLMALNTHTVISHKQ